MSGRPQPSSAAPSPAASAGNPTAQQQSSAPISPALAALRGAGAPPKKHFGPPTMQLASDTVVFQAAKIPLSSSRLSSAPGTAGLAASGSGGRGGYAPREMDLRRGGGYAEPPGPGGHPMNRATAYDRPPSPSRHYPGERGAHRTSLGERHVSSPQSGLPAPPQQLRGMPRSLPPPMARERVQGREQSQRAMMNGTREPTRLQQDEASGGYSADRGEGEFTHLLMQEDAPVAARPRPPMESMTRPPTVTQRQERRPSSANKNKADRNLVKLTVRVMKDGDKLGFGIRNDSNRKLKVSTLQTNSTAAKSTLKIGDTILSVNGIDLRDMGFLEVIQQLKATKPGELVFDIERSLKDDDEEASLSGAEGSQQGETMDLDSPLSVAEKRFGPAATQSSPGAPPQQQQQQPPQQLPLPPPRRSESAPMAQTAHRNAASPLAPPVSLVQQRGPPIPQQNRVPTGVGMPVGPGTGRERNIPQQQHAGHMGELYGPGGPIEPPRKRPRPDALTPAQVEMELARMDKQHRHVLNTLSLELKKERTEKLGLEEKNAALRKRLQNMLIECDEVRVKASSTVATIKEHAQRDIHELRQALQSARAQLRLQDRGPDVGRTDSIVNDLHATKDQLNRLRKVEMERATNLSNRYSLESRQAEREASRTRDRLVEMCIGQLRDVARRNYNNNGVRNQGGNDKGKNSSSIVVHYEGLRRLAFVKLFGLPCSYEWYTSDEFYSTTLVRHALPKQDDIMDIFGNALCHEERAGLFIVASAPMNVAYDPTIEKLTLSCSWAEQNQLRELARNFRF